MNSGGRGYARHITRLRGKTLETVQKFKVGGNKNSDGQHGDRAHGSPGSRSRHKERAGMAPVGFEDLFRGRPAEAGRGGEGGIRTHDTLTSIPPFQGGQFNRSCTSPGATPPKIRRRGNICNGTGFHFSRVVDILSIDSNAIRCIFVVRPSLL
jgi:hypothetical protein